MRSPTAKTPRKKITVRRPKRSGTKNPKSAKVKKAVTHRVRSRKAAKPTHNQPKRTLSLRGDHMAQPGKFGRKQPLPEWAAPRLKVKDFVDFSALPSPAPVIDFMGEVSEWPMYLNDQLGCCTASCAGHELEAWTTYAKGAEFSVTDQDILHLYEATGGYVPGDPSTDNGAVIQDVLAYWQEHGIAGHKIVAFAKLENHTRTELRQALELFGSVYLGINCPQSAIDQFDADEPWTYVPGSPIAGGHAVPLQKWDSTHSNPATVITWGRAKRCGPRFIETYVEEAWVIITEDWINTQGVTPTYGVNMQQLAEDFTLLTGKPAPALNPTPGTTPELNGL